MPFTTKQNKKNLNSREFGNIMTLNKNKDKTLCWLPPHLGEEEEEEEEEERGEEDERGEVRGEE